MMTDTQPIQIQRVEDARELHHHYQGQTQAQSVYLELDPEERTLRADYDGEIGGGVPEGVWSRRRLRFRLPVLPRTNALNALMEEIAPLAAEICDGYEERRENGNARGTYTDDASLAIEEIEDLIRDREWHDVQLHVWDAADYWGPLGGPEVQAEDVGLSADATDDELDTLAEDLERRAREGDFENCDIVTGARGFLEDLRYRLQAEREDV